MPLSEFLRMAREKLESSEQKTDDPSRSENGLGELVWENGQIMIQGQGSRVSRSHTGNDLNLKTDSRARDSGAVHSTNGRFVKFGGVESILNDRVPVVPSDVLDLSQDDEMGPWLSYPIQDALGQDYVSEILPEISGVTGNGMSTRNSFVSVSKRSSCDQSVGTALKISSSKDGPLGSWLPQNRQGSDAFGSGGSDIVSRNTSNHQDATFENPAQGRDVVNGTGSMKMESQNIRSNVLNFSHFSRPANLFKVNLPNSDRNPASGSSGVGRMDGREKGPVDLTPVERLKSTPNVHGSSTTIPMVNPREPPASIPKGASLLERAEYLCQGTSDKNDKPMSNTDNSTKRVPDGERIVEPLAASSSVGSGNSAVRVSCEQTHNSKRKFRDNEESECRSDDVDTESLDVKKPNSLRGSKRSRAAEVHNLSERRRRDRINEKMRALQELIPNCNKVDKASMLDEAIEYIKTLQLQVQIKSMGAGLCMPPMIPTGMPHVHPAHVPHFPPMGVGMGVNVGVGVGIGMGFGMGMLDMYGGSSGRAVFPVPTVQAPSIAPPGSVMANFQKIPGPNLPFFGHPGQGLPNVVPSAPFVSLSTAPPATSALGLSATTSRNQCNSEVPSTSPIINPRDLVTAMSSQSILCNAETSCSADDKSNQLQAKSEVLDKSASVQENKMGTDVMGLGTRTSTTTSDISKEPGENNKSPHGLHAYSTRDGNSGFA